MIYLFFVISIIIHEIGHIIVSNIFNVNFGKVNISFFGFSNKNLVLSGNSFFNKIFILMAGSLFNFCFFILFLILKVYNLAIMNLYLGIFNLLPIIPLDGGNILICLISKISNEKMAIRYTMKISKMFLIIITFMYSIGIIILKNFSLFILILYLWFLNIKEEKQFDLYKKISDNLEKIHKINC